MKRRVARDHSNKRVLRSLSARHRFHHDAFVVLCDSSFLRSLVLLPEVQQPGHGQGGSSSSSRRGFALPSNQKGREGGRDGKSVNAGSRTPVPRGLSSSSSSRDHQGASGRDGETAVAARAWVMLKQLTLQSLDVLDRHTGGSSSSHPGANDPGAGTGGGGLSTQLSRLRYVYLPSTARALYRWCEPPQERKSTVADPNPGGRSRRGSASTPPARQKSSGKHSEKHASVLPPFSRGSIQQLLNHLSPVGGDGASHLNPGMPPSTQEPSRADVTPSFLREEMNEAKAIAQYVEHHLQLRHATAPPPPTLPEGAALLGADARAARASFIFTATQSHDVRRLLPEASALLRLTTHPTAMWVEVRGDHYAYETQQGTDKRSRCRATPSQHYSAAPHEHAKDVGRSESEKWNAGLRSKALSPADQAFLRHLGKDVPGLGGVLSPASPPPPQGLLATSAAAGGGGETPGKTSEKGGGPAAATTQLRRKRKVSTQPNPLSMKKKQKKETIRI